MTATNPAPLKHVLMVRLDRIGDLILTLPVEEALPGTIIKWWIPKGLSFITAAASPPRDATEVTRDFSFKKLWSVFRELRAQRYEAAIVFHAPWWVGFALWLARVPIRAGVKSQWHSFLFFNRAVRQKRSRAEHSELEYNYLLLEQALRLAPASLPRTHLKLRSSLDVSRFGLTPNQYSVVHPGMSGSALNWPSHRYEEYIRSLVARGEQVVITGTAADEPYLAPLRGPLAELSAASPQGQTNLIWLDKKLSGPELIGVLASARSILAPSTGVLHLAASTGRRTIGIYSPVRVQQPRRWGPQGEDTITFMPDVECPGELACLGPACVHFNCMERIRI